MFSFPLLDSQFFSHSLVSIAFIQWKQTADARRSISPSPRRLLDIRKKQNSLDSSTTQCDDSTPPTNESSKFENISDNGSEISDEGYRSLGVIQSNAQKSKDSTLQNQNSVEDAEINGESLLILSHFMIFIFMREGFWSMTYFYLQNFWLYNFYTF